MALAYLLLVAVKIVWVAGAQGPAIFGDEHIYKSLARSLFLGTGYVINGEFWFRYPPLYPVVLAPAFFFQDSYDWMLRINVLVSSAVIFPIWWIARQFLPRRESWLAVLLGSITPFHWVMPRVLMSENLFVPLVIAAIATVLMDTWRPSALRCLLTGALWGVAQMTRYAFIPALPILFLLWWFQPWMVRQVRLTELFRGRLHRLLFLFAGCAAVYSSWTLYVKSQRASTEAARALGLLVAVNSLKFERIPSGERFLELFFWITVCLAYLTLASAPYLHLAMSSVLSRVKVIRRREWFFVLAFMAIMGAFTVTTAFLSWRWFGRRSYLEGRYLMYLFPLLPTLALVLARRLDALPVSRRLVSMWIGLGAALSLVYVAYRLLINRSPFALTPFFADIVWVVPDVVSFNMQSLPLVGSLIWVLLPMLVLQAALYTVVQRQLALLVTVVALVFNVVSLVYLTERIEAIQKQTIHVRMLARVVLPYAGLGDSIAPIPVLVDSGTALDAELVHNSLAFWGIERKSYSLEVGALDHPVELSIPGWGIILTRTTYPNPRATYLTGDTEFTIHVVGLPPDPSKALLVRGYGLTKEITCRPSHEHPAGSSTLWFKTQNANPRIVVVLNAKEYKVDYRSPEYVTARISCEPLQRGTVALYLFDPATQLRSNAVQFDLRPKSAPARMGELP